jgi:polysaccharide chain length determinant protein (PEP-CTERM system associated)
VIPGKQYSFDTLVEIARRRVWLIVIPAILIGMAGAVWVTRLPDVFRSDTLILVVPQRVPESYVRATVTARIEDRLQTISQQILSRTRLEQIVQDFSLYARDRAKGELMEDIVERMRTRDISIEIVKGDAFRVSYAAEDPRVAMRVTERLASLFIDESLRDREILAEGTNQFMATQLDEARRQLVLHEKTLEAYQRQHNGELPAQMSANLQGLHNAEMALQSIGESLNRDRERRLLLERTVTDIVDAPDPAAVAAAATPSHMSTTLAEELRNAEQGLLAVELKLRPEHPDVRRLRRNVEELKRRVEAEQLEGELTAEPSAPVVMDYARRKRLTDAKAELENLDRQLEAKIAEESRLRGVLGMYQARIENTPMREAELAAIMRDYETLQQSYRSLLSKKEESQIAANLERRQIGEQFKILDPARVPEKPASPDRPRLYLLVLLGAWGFGIALAATGEYFDRTLRSEADVRSALNLLVLATVPSIRNTVEASRRLRRNVAVGAGVATLLMICATVTWRLLS